MRWQRASCGRNDQTIVLDAQLDRVTQPALLDEGLRNANAAGIADTNQLGSHASSTRVITL